jgi:hypothetical protein
MKKISLRIFLAFATFLIGISFTAFWLLNRELPEVPIPETQKLSNENFVTDTQISKQQKTFWENVLLPRFKELPLMAYSGSTDEVYRFMLLPTFDAPVVVRIWRTKDEYFLTTKKTNGQGGFGMKKFGKLSYEKTRPLTEAEWNNFIKLLNEVMFWNMPYIDVNELTPEDGASWTLEGFDKKTFHTVDRILPKKEFETLCVYLLQLSGLEADYKGYYSYTK